MRICVFGAGAVGSHFAVRLALAGHDVSCVMRGAHLDAVKANGLTLRVGDAEFKAKVSASDDPAALGPQDVVICTLKATALPSLATGLQPLLGEDTAVVFAQNGIPWWYDIGFQQNILPFRIWPFSIPAAGCAQRSRKSGSSAAWCFRPTKLSHPA
jgi:2-dehydropantoate 2-reductase